MKTSERLLAALRHTDDDIEGLDREIRSTEDQLARLRALRSLLDQVASVVNGEIAQPVQTQPAPGPPAAVPAPPAPADRRVDRDGKSHALSTVLDQPRNPPPIKQPAEQWLPALIERVRDCIQEHGPATGDALQLRLKCARSRLYEALRSGPFERREGLYHLCDSAQSATAPQTLYPGNRTADEVRQAAAYVLEEAGEPLFLPQIAEDIGVTGQELLPLLRDHPWFCWQQNQGWALTPEGAAALEAMEAA